MSPNGGHDHQRDGGHGPRRHLWGKDYARAARELVELGLVPSRGQAARAEGVGTVVGLSPTGRLTLGSTVVLTVAVAPTPVSAPAPALTKRAPTSKPAGAKATNPQGAAKPGKSKGKGKQE